MLGHVRTALRSGEWDVSRGPCFGTAVPRWVLSIRGRAQPTQEASCPVVKGEASRQSPTVAQGNTKLGGSPVTSHCWFRGST